MGHNLLLLKMTTRRPTAECGYRPLRPTLATIDSLKRVARGIGDGRALKQMAREARWAGNAVRCVCCGWHGRAFRPSCHDRPGVSQLCARCMSGSADRALTLALRNIMPQLPAGGRILDVEPSRYTRRWLDRFNQFDQRTLSRTAPDADFRDDVTIVSIPKGMCHLVICSHGVRRDRDQVEVARALHRFTAAGGTVIIGTPAEVDAASAVQLRPALEEAGFDVTVDSIARRITAVLARRHGLLASDEILICTTSQASPQDHGGHQHHGHGVHGS
jgi:hypothetical protein